MYINKKKSGKHVRVKTERRKKKKSECVGEGLIFFFFLNKKHKNVEKIRRLRNKHLKDRNKERTGRKGRRVEICKERLGVKMKRKSME